MLRPGIAALLIVCSGTSWPQTQPDPDWPCVQVLVPRISSASVWDGPGLDRIREDPGLDRKSGPIVAEVVDAGQPLTQAWLESFLSGIDTSQLNNALTWLFAEILDGLNQKRAVQIETIKKYTREQREYAASIESMLDEITDIKSGEPDSSRLPELETRLAWQKRIFLQREKSLRHFCELPRELARQAGDAARIISMKLVYE